MYKIHILGYRNQGLDIFFTSIPFTLQYKYSLYFNQNYYQGAGAENLGPTAKKFRATGQLLLRPYYSTTNTSKIEGRRLSSIWPETPYEDSYDSSLEHELTASCNIFLLTQR